MKLKIIKPVYVTTTVKRHLHAFLESGKTSAKVNTKHYSILKGTPLKNGYEYIIAVNTPYTSESTGQREFEKQTIICQYLNDSEAWPVKLFIKTNGQEFLVGSKEIQAKNADDLGDIMRKSNLPFHHYSTYEKAK
jgi:hypothetical protein